MARTTPLLSVLGCMLLIGRAPSTTARYLDASKTPSSTSRKSRDRDLTRQKQETAATVTNPVQLFTRYSGRAACSAVTFSKQTCVFNNVCFVFDGPNMQSVTVVLEGAGGNSAITNAAGRQQTMSILRSHLSKLLQGQVADLHYLLQGGNKTNSSLAEKLLAGHTENQTHEARIEQAPTVLWRVASSNQESFGHALVNEVFPMFLAISDQYGGHTGSIPQNLQLLITPRQWNSPVLPGVIYNAISPRMKLLASYLNRTARRGKKGVCFRNLMVGDGGYVAASRASLANSGLPQQHAYSHGPSMFSSSNWWAFRSYGLLVAGVQAPRSSRPLIVLNDKHYFDSENVLQDDRRMILDIEMLADQIRAAYPSADVLPVRFRDWQWPDQLRLMSTATVFITTQGSSAFRLVYLPAGATCIMIGSPQLPDEQQWQSFHELDRWFPLSYVQFERYVIDYNKTDEYLVWEKPGHWQPADQDAARRWWLYNAHIRVNFDRLKPMLDRALAIAVLS